MSENKRTAISRGSSYATAVIAVLAIVWTVVNVEQVVTTVSRPRTVPFRQVSATFQLPHGGQVLGRRGAPVQVVVLSDYQCPACQRLWRRLSNLLNQDGSSVQVTYYHYALRSHPEAAAAAIAAECAAASGAFRAMSDTLFSHPDSLGMESLTRYALSVGVPDAAAFVSCMADSAMLQRSLLGREIAGRLAVRATPAIIVGQDVYEGIPWDLERIIKEKALTSARTQ